MFCRPYDFILWFIMDYFELKFTMSDFINDNFVGFGSIASSNSTDIIMASFLLSCAQYISKIGRISWCNLYSSIIIMQYVHVQK